MLPFGVLAACLLPGWVQSGVLPVQGVVALAVSSVIHAFYFSFLTAAYYKADLSFVYPHARGVGTLIAVLGGVLIFSDAPSLLGWTGIGLAILATFVEAVFMRKRRETSDFGGIRFTLLTGFSIAAYLLVDKFGVSQIPSTVYLTLLFFGCTLLLSPWMLRGGRALAQWKRSKRKVLSAAFFLFSSYAVILLAMETSPVSYVVAARATGIIASGLAGMFFFSETVSRARWAAITLIAVGVACIGLA